MQIWATNDQNSFFLGESKNYVEKKKKEEIQEKRRENEIKGVWDDMK